jgi:hypothetical protein
LNSNPCGLFLSLWNCKRGFMISKDHRSIGVSLKRIVNTCHTNLMPAILLDMFNIVLCYAYVYSCLGLTRGAEVFPPIQRRGQNLAVQWRSCWTHPGHWNPPAEGLLGMQVFVAAYDSGLRDSNRLLCLSRLQLLDKIDPFTVSDNHWD